MLMQTEEEDFNDKFRNEMAGSSGLMGLNESEEEEEEKNTLRGNQGQATLSSGAMVKDM